MKRILIIGSSGAGKSTIAKKVAAITELELFHLDQLYWKPNWVEPSKPEWRKIIEKVADKDNWIMDGNYSGTFDIRMPRAEMVIWLDFPMPICLWRAIKRSLVNFGKTRADMAPGCPEKIDLKFLGYVAHFPIAHRPRIVRAVQLLRDDQKLIVLRSDKAADAFLEKLKNWKREESAEKRDKP